MPRTNSSAGENGSMSVGEPHPRIPSGRTLTRIKVVGVGDAGCKCVFRMSKQGVVGVRYLMVNSDIKPPESGNGVTERILVAPLAHTKRNELALEESDKRLRNAFDNTDLVLITAGMGGSTGTGFAPRVATMAKESGAFVVGMVTTPFSFEGNRRIGEAIAGVARLRSSVDNLIVIHSDRLLRYVSKDCEIVEAFRKADEVVSQGILGVCELLNEPVEVNVDFAHVRTVLGYPGGALLAVGLGHGRAGLLEAAQHAISNPLLNLSITSAKGILLTVKGGQGLTLEGVDATTQMLGRSLKKQARILFGMSVDHTLEDNVHLTLIATGL